MYDVIGDVHGHYDELSQLLTMMGYRYSAQSHLFSNPNGRKVVFVGDYIDRGTQNIETIRLVRNMVDSGQAYAIMGNHDFNAVMMTIPDPYLEGEYLRRHTRPNLKQQKTFLAEVDGRPDLYEEVTQWIRTLPVYLQIGHANFVHACWYPSGINYLTKQGHIDDAGRITDDGWYAAGDKTNPSHDYFDIVLKGAKSKIPARARYRDAQNEVRDKTRIAWWVANPQTNGDAYTSMPQSAYLKESFNGSHDNPHAKTIIRDLRRMPVNAHIFFGHISLVQNRPAQLAHNVTCVDYGIGKGGCLTAFRVKDMARPAIGEFVSVHPLPASRKGRPTPPK
jgi:hypothetical protein